MRIQNWIRIYGKLENFNQTVADLKKRNLYISLMNSTRKHLKDAHVYDWNSFTKCSFSQYFTEDHMRGIIKGYN
jgi:hypothetical protein